MNRYFKLSALAVSLAASGMAFADTSETKGGIKIKTDDGRFEANIGGRIHFDGNLIQKDDGANFGSNAAGGGTDNSGLYFRRIYLTLAGKLYGWSYKIENDFASNNASGATTNGFQEVWLGTEIGPGFLQIGQRKPFRAMEELTSSNEVLMIERPFASASGGFLAGGTAGASSREFQDGLFYSGNGDLYTWGVGVYSLRSLTTVGTQGTGESLRGTFTPVKEDGMVIHLGASFSGEQPANNQNAANAPISLGAGGFGYGGRRGPSLNLGSTDNTLQTYGLEYANVFGPFFAQAEYLYQQQTANSAAAVAASAAGLKNVGDQTIQAFYVQTSFFLTGESKPYNGRDGVFKNVKPINDWGAVELTARYDSAWSHAGYIGSSCSTATGSNACNVSAVTVGANYYVNPNVRFMLNYVMGDADKGNVKDQPNTVAARAQISF